MSVRAHNTRFLSSHKIFFKPFFLLLLTLKVYFEFILKKILKNFNLFCCRRKKFNIFQCGFKGRKSQF